MTRAVRVELVGDPAGAVDLDPGRARAREARDQGSGRTVITADDGDADRVAVVDRLPPGPDGRARFEVVVDGWRFELAVEDAARAALRRRATRTQDAATTSAPNDIRAIIPGRIAAVRVTAGDRVAAGQTLLVVEAMKMQNELRAPRAATVERVAVAEGQTIDRGDLLVVLR